MVATISSGDLGLFNNSKTIGQASVGQGNEQVYVNAGTGNLVLRRQDEVIAGLGLDTAIVRTYNSQGQLTDGDGDNFYFQFNQKLINLTGTANQPGSTISRVAGDGSETLFRYDANLQQYLSTDGSGAHDTLTYNQSANLWTWTEGSSQVSEQYKAVAGGLLMVFRTDAEGRATQFQHNPQGLVHQVTDGSGQVLTVQYTGQHVTGLTLSSRGETTQHLYYSYDTEGRLASVSVDLTPDGDISDGVTYTTQYSYDGDSRRIQQIRQSDGTVVTVGYIEQDGQFRVAQITTGEGGSARIQSYSYDLANNTTTIVQVDDSGFLSGPTTTLQYDDAGKLLQETSPADSNGQRLVTAYSYDSDDNLTTVTHPQGRTTRYSHDARGNVLSIQDPEGNTVTRSYDEHNQLVREITWLKPDADGAGSAQASEPRTRHLIYDAQHRLRFTVAADGSVAETRYDDSNTQARVVSVLLWQEGIAFQNEYTLTELEAWVQQQSPSQAQRTDTVLDFRGEVAQVQRYNSLDARGHGVLDGSHSTTYSVYDAWGRLLATVDPRGTGANSQAFRTTYTYDGLGRQLSTTDAKGHTTRYLYNDAQSQVVSTTPNGLQTTRLYNAVGQLVSETTFDATNSPVHLGETRHFYDELGRLRATQDASGAVSHQLYDNLGRVVARIDSTGAVQKFTYDQQGQLSREMAFATRLNSSQMASLLEKDGQNRITGINEQIAFADIQPATSEQDRLVQRFYDAANRLRFVIDGEGAVTEFRYNGAGERLQTLQHSHPAKETALTYSLLKAQYGSSNTSLAVTSSSASRTADPIQSYPRAQVTGFDRVSNQSFPGTALAQQTESTRSAQNIYQEAQAQQKSVTGQTEAANTSTITTGFLRPPLQPFALSNSTQSLQNYTATQNGRANITTAVTQRNPTQPYTYSTATQNLHRTQTTTQDSVQVARGKEYFQSSQVQIVSGKTTLRAGSVPALSASGDYRKNKFSRFTVKVVVTPLSAGGRAMNFSYNSTSRTYNGSITFQNQTLPAGDYRISTTVEEWRNIYKPGYKDHRTVFSHTELSRTSNKDVLIRIGTVTHPTKLSWPQSVQPANTSVRFSYRTADSGSFQTAPVSTANGKHNVSIQGLTNRNYDYKIEYLRNGVVAQTATGVFSGADNQSNSLSTTFRYDYTAVQQKTGSALTGYLPDVAPESISSIKAVVRDQSGNIVSTANTSPAIIKRERGSWDGRVNLKTDGELPTGQYNITLETTRSNGSVSTNTLYYEVGQQVEYEPTTLSWPASLQPDDAAVSLQYRTPGGSWNNAGVVRKGNHHQAELGHLADGQYEYRIEYRDTGSVLKSASGTFAVTKGQAETLDADFRYQATRFVESAGSSITGYLTEAQAGALQQVEARVYDQNGKLVSTALTYPAQYLEWFSANKKSGEAYDGRVHLNTGARLGDGRYRVELTLTQIDGSTRTDSFAYEVGEQTEYQPTLFRWPASSQPVGSQVSFSYQMDGVERDVPVSQQGDSLQVNLGHLPEGHYSYTIRYNDGEDILKAASGSLQVALGGTVSGQTTFAFDVTELEDVSGTAIQGYNVPASVEQVVARVYDADNKLVSTAETWPRLYADYQGDVNLAQGQPLPQGRYRVELTLHHDGGTTTQSQFDYEVGQQPVQNQQLSWSDQQFMLQVGETVTFHYRRAGSGDAFSTAVVEQANNQWQVNLGYELAGDYEIQIRTHDSHGRLLREAQGQLAANSTGELSLSYTLPQYSRSSSTGYAIDGYLSAEQAAALDYVEAVVVDRTTGETLSAQPVRTYIDSATLRDGSFSGAVNLITGRALADGDYSVTVTFHYLDGREESQPSFVHQVGPQSQSVNQPVLSLSVDEPYPVSELTLSYRRPGESSFTALLLSVNNREITLDELASGDYEYQLQYTLTIDGQPLIKSGQGRFQVKAGETTAIALNARAADAGDIRTSRAFYDAQGRLAGELDAEGYLIEYHYNRLGQQVQSTQYAQRIADYDSQSGWLATAPLERLRPLASESDRHTYQIFDGQGRLQASIDAEGYVTEFGYDPAGNLIRDHRYASSLSAMELQIALQAVNNDPARLTLGQDRALGQVRPLTTDQDRIQERQFNARNELVLESRQGVATRYTYNSIGQVLTQQSGLTHNHSLMSGSVNLNDSAARTLRYEYDVQGRLISETDGRGNETRHHYNPQGHRIASYNSMGDVWQYTYDDVGRLTRSLSPSGELTEYTYNSTGELIESRQVQTHRYGVVKQDDVRGWRVYDSSPEGATFQSVFDPALGYDVLEFQGSGISNGFELNRPDSKDWLDSSGTRVEWQQSVEGSFKIYFLVNTPEGRSYIEFRPDIIEPDLAISDSSTKYYKFPLTGVNDGQWHTISIDLQKELAKLAPDLKIENIVDFKVRGSGRISDVRVIPESTDVQRFEYNRRGQQTEATDAEGYKTRSSYNAFGELTELARAINRANSQWSKTSFDYDRLGRETRSTQILSGQPDLTVQQSYDAFGQVISATDADGATTSNNFDHLGRLTSQTDALNRAQHWSYDAFGRELTATDASGATVTYQYDDQERSQTVTTAEGVVRKTLFNEQGESWQVWLDGVKQAEFHYDASGNRTQTTDALGHNTRAEYDANNQLVLETDAQGVQTRYRYDPQGRLLETVIDPDGLALRSQTRYSHRQEDTTDASGTVTRHLFDGNGQRIRTIVDPDDLALITDFTYDGLGQLQEQREGVLINGQAQYQRIERYSYDEAGRMLSQTVDPDGLNLTTTYTYNGSGQLSSETNALGQTTWYVYDAAGQLRFTLTPDRALNGGMQYAVSDQRYDNNGRPTTRISHSELVTLPELTVAGVSSVLTDTSNDRQTRVIYDQDGRQRYIIDAQGQVTEQRYDSAGRIRAVIQYANPVNPLSGTPANLVTDAAQDRETRTLYDAAGRATHTLQLFQSGNKQRARVTETVFNARGETVGTIAYNQSLDLDSQTVADLNRNDAANQVNLFLYDAAGRQTHTINSLGQVTEIRHNDVQRTETTVRYATTVARSDASEWASLSVEDLPLTPDNSQDRHTVTVFDTAGRKIALSSRNWVNNAWQDETETFTYDALGQRISLTDARGFSTRFAHDAAGRLTHTLKAVDQHQGYLTTYSYDALGRVQEQRSYAQATALTTQPASINTATLVTSDDRRMGYSYSAAGLTRTEMVYTLAGKALVTERQYNSFGEETVLLEAKGLPEQRATYRVYDALGQLLQETKGLPNANRDTLAASRTQDGAATTLYSYSRFGEVQAMTDPRGDGFTSQQHFDQLGRKVAETDALNGQTKTVLDNFGNTIRTTDPNGNTGYFIYDSNNQLRYQINPDGGVQSYRYNSFGEVTETVHYNNTLSGDLSRFTLASIENQLAKSPISDQRTTITYDQQGRKTSETRKGYNAVTRTSQSWVQRYEYNAGGLLSAETDATGARQDYHYNGLGQRTRVFGPQVERIVTAGAQTQTAVRLITDYQYDAFGNRTTMEEGRYRKAGESTIHSGTIHTTNYQYDHANRLVQEQGPEYAAVVNPAQKSLDGTPTTTSLRQTTQTKYDAFGRITSRSTGGYNNTGQLVGELRTERSAYDRLGRVTYQLDAGNGLSRFEYDAAGNKTAEYRYDDPISVQQSVTLRLSGDSYQGNPKYRVYADGQVIGEGEVTWSTAKGQKKEWRDVTFDYFGEHKPKHVWVEFYNDAYNSTTKEDRNLLLDWIEVDNTRYQSEHSFYNHHSRSRNGTETITGAGRLEFTIQQDSYQKSGTKTLVAEGSETTIHSTTAGNQLSPEVAALGNGGYVAFWRTETPGEINTRRVKGQVFDAAGNPVGAEISLNQSKRTQYGPSVEGTQDGGFIVTWHESGVDGSSWAVLGQKFTAEGEPEGAAQTLNTYTSSTQSWPHITQISDDRYLVTWSSNGQDGSSFGIYGQLFDASLTPLGSEFRINSTTDKAQQRPHASALADGGFVVTWMSKHENPDDPDTFGVYSQRFDATGLKTGPEVHVNQYILGEQTYPRVQELSNGGYVITWQSNLQDGSSYGVYARFYDRNGDPVQPEQRINVDFTRSNQMSPRVKELQDGSVLFVWRSYGQDGSAGGVFAKRYTQDGAALTDTQQINETTQGHQNYPAVAILESGRAITMWHSQGQDEDDAANEYGIYGRQIAFEPVEPAWLSTAKALQAEDSTATYRKTNYAYDANNRQVRSWSEPGLFFDLSNAAENPNNIAVGFQNNVVAELRTTFDANGNAIIQYDAKGQATYTLFDAAGNPVVQVDRSGAVIASEFNGQGQRVGETRYGRLLQWPDNITEPQARHQWLQQQLENNSWLNSLSGPQDRQQQFVYDGRGLVIEQRTLRADWTTLDASLKASATRSDIVTQLAYDGADRLVQQRQLNGTSTAGSRDTLFSYDATGLETGQQSPKFSDFRGQQVRENTQYSYDLYGNRVLETRVGQGVGTRVIRHEYNAAHLRTATIDARASANASHYDGRSTFTYDSFGNVITQTRQQTAVDGTRKAVIDWYGYDAHNREVARANSSDASVVHTVAYNQHNQIIGKGINTDWRKNAVGAAVEQQYQEYYVYDQLGNLFKTNADNGTPRIYLYDRNGNATLEISAKDSNVLDLVSNAQQAVNQITQDNAQWRYSLFDANDRRIKVVEPPVDLVTDSLNQDVSWEVEQNSNGQTTNQVDSRTQAGTRLVPGGYTSSVQSRSSQEVWLDMNNSADRSKLGRTDSSAVALANPLPAENTTEKTTTVTYIDSEGTSYTSASTGRFSVQSGSLNTRVETMHLASNDPRLQFQNLNLSVEQAEELQQLMDSNDTLLSGSSQGAHVGYVTRTTRSTTSTRADTLANGQDISINTDREEVEEAVHVFVPLVKNGTTYGWREIVIRSTTANYDVTTDYGSVGNTDAVDSIENNALQTLPTLNWQRDGRTLQLSGDNLATLLNSDLTVRLHQENAQGQTLLVNDLDYSTSVATTLENNTIRLGITLLNNEGTVLFSTRLFEQAGDAKGSIQVPVGGVALGDEEAVNTFSLAAGHQVSRQGSSQVVAIDYEEATRVSEVAFQPVGSISSVGSVNTYSENRHITFTETGYWVNAPKVGLHDGTHNHHYTVSSGGHVGLVVNNMTFDQPVKVIVAARGNTVIRYPGARSKTGGRYAGRTASENHGSATYTQEITKNGPVIVRTPTAVSRYTGKFYLSSPDIHFRMMVTVTLMVGDEIVQTLTAPYAEPVNATANFPHGFVVVVEDKSLKNRQYVQGRYVVIENLPEQARGVHFTVDSKRLFAPVIDGQAYVDTSVLGNAGNLPYTYTVTDSAQAGVSGNTLLKSKGILNSATETVSSQRRATTRTETITTYTRTGSSSGGESSSVFYSQAGLDNRLAVRSIALAVGQEAANDGIIARSSSYNAFGEIIAETDGLGNVTELRYDQRGHLVARAAAETDIYAENMSAFRGREVESYGYNAFGEQVLQKKSVEAANDADGAARAAVNAYNLKHAQTNTRQMENGRVTVEKDAEGYIKSSSYDAFGNLRAETKEVYKKDERGTGTAALYAKVVYHYDANDQLKRINRFQDNLAAVNYAWSGSSLFDAYDYDELGNRIRHRNAMYGQQYNVPGINFDGNGGTSTATAGQEVYYYDGLGRITRHTSYNGVVTKYAYLYRDNVARRTLAATGDYQQTNYGTEVLGGYIVSRWNGGMAGANAGATIDLHSLGAEHVQTEVKDYFGKLVQKNDLGNQQFHYYYNYAGWLSRQTGDTGRTGADVWTTRDNQDIRFLYHHNGYLHKKIDYGISVPLDGDASPENSGRMPAVTEYRYDINGNRTGELYYRGTDLYNNRGRTVYQHSNALYDERNRVVEITGRDEYGSHYQINYTYDAFGNRRSVESVYNGRYVDRTDGKIEGTPQNFYYTYDRKNRFTTTLGALNKGAITPGESGSAITYNGLDQRYLVTRGDGTTKDRYQYDGNGRLTTVEIDSGRGFVLRSERQNNSAGQVQRQIQYDNNGIKVSVTENYTNTDGILLANRTTEYDKNGRATGDQVRRRYQLWNDGSTVAKMFVTGRNADGKAYTTLDYDYKYEAWDSYKQIRITVDADNTDLHRSQRNKWGPGTTRMAYDSNGHIRRSFDEVANRELVYASDSDGRTLVREEIDRDDNYLPEKNRVLRHFYYFNGQAVGDVGNDKTPTRYDYAQSLAQQNDDRHQSFEPTPVESADFDQNYQPINPDYPAHTYSQYEVQDAGEDLRSIAASQWGDANLWYLLADANGLKGTETLAKGQRLTVPNVVTNIHNTSSTFRPYDPGLALGDTNPTLPDVPPPPPPKKGGGCGAASVIVIVVAAVATVFTAGAAAVALGCVASTTLATAGASTFFSAGAAALVGGAAVAGTTVSFGAAVAGAFVGGFAGSLAGQVTGVALGTQDGISLGDAFRSGVMSGFGAVAGAAIGTALPDFGVATQAANGVTVTPSWYSVAARAALSSTVGNALGSAAGVTSFSWRKVAVAGAGAGANQALRTETGAFGEALDGSLESENFLDQLPAQLTEELVTESVQTAIYGDKFDFAGVAGNAVANSYVHASSQTQTVREKAVINQQEDTLVQSVSGANTDVLVNATNSDVRVFPVNDPSVEWAKFNPETGTLIASSDPYYGMGDSDIQRVKAAQSLFESMSVEDPDYSMAVSLYLSTPHQVLSDLNTFDEINLDYGTRIQKYSAQMDSIGQGTPYDGLVNAYGNVVSDTRQDVIQQLEYARSQKLADHAQSIALRTNGAISHTTIIEDTVGLLFGIGALNHLARGGISASRARVGSRLLSQRGSVGIDINRAGKGISSKLTTAQRINKLDIEGHAPIRHGGPNRVTDFQLQDRVTKSIDPASGTIFDAFNKFPDGKPKLHKVGKHATAFTSDDALLQADTFVRSSTQFQKNVSISRTNGDIFVDAIDVPLRDVFGSNYLDNVRGFTRLGSKKNPTGYTPTDFKDGTIKAIYRLDQDGNIKLHTLYPNPLPKR